MSRVKNLLVVTNPLTYLFGIPIVLGIALGVTINDTGRKTYKITKELYEDTQEY